MIDLSYIRLLRTHCLKFLNAEIMRRFSAGCTQTGIMIVLRGDPAGPCCQCLRIGIHGSDINKFDRLTDVDNSSSSEGRDQQHK